MREPIRTLRLAARGLLHTPTVALIAILTLGLGVGAAVAIFSLVDAVLLRPLPFPHADQLVSVREQDRQFPSMSVAYPDYLDWVRDNHSFTALAAHRGNGATLTHLGPPVMIHGEDATANYFAVLGVAPELGRSFTAAEDRAGAPGAVVISDAFWRTRLGAERNVLGQTIELDARPRTIVGVMPPGFPGVNDGPSAPQFWVPLGAKATADSGMMQRGNHPGIDGLGRLREGVTLEQARSDLSRIARALAQQYPKSNADEGVTVTSYLQRVVRNSNPAGLWMLLGAVGLLLLVACANLANLLLARAAGRQKANAIRTALGASRGRLIAEHLAESLCLGVAGTALGLSLAWAAMRAIPAWLPPEMARAHSVSLDAQVLGFAFGLALLTSVLFGIAPALRAGRIRPSEVLKQGGRDASSASGGGRLREILVAVEMGLALVLLAGAGLLVRSLVRLQAVNPGFNPHGVLSFEVSLPGANYAAAGKGWQFYQEALRRLHQTPGVTAAATVYPLPFSGNDWENSYTIVGRPAPLPGHTPSTNFEMVAGDYLAAMGAHLLRGRSFNDADTATTTPVLMVDAMFAQRNWPGPDPNDAALGKQVHLNGKDRTIVGVVGRIMEYDLDGGTEMDRLPESFVPLSQGGDQTDAYFTLRSAAANPMGLRAPAMAVIASLDSNLPLSDVDTMDARVASWLQQRRLTLWLLAAFAGMALALAAIGIYGVLSYAVAEREREFGLRMALGADRGRILAMVLRQGLTTAAYGALGGLLAALALGRFAASFVYGISASDPATLAAVPVVLLAVAAVACWVPARRATRVDPMVALRGE